LHNLIFRRQRRSPALGLGAHGTKRIGEISPLCIDAFRLGRRF
jgi:hypothetical protein